MARFSWIILALCASLSAPASGADEASLEPPKLKALKGEAKSLRESRKEVLDVLYHQLSIAQDSESAQRVVSAIDTFWAQSGSDTTDLLMQRAKIAIQERNYDLAVSILTAIGEIDPRFVAAWNQLATVYYLQDRYPEAMLGLRRVLALDPRHFKAIEGLGIILREIGKKDAALVVLRRALAIHPFLESAKQAEEELAREIEGQGI